MYFYQVFFRKIAQKAVQLTSFVCAYLLVQVHFSTVTFFCLILLTLTSFVDFAVLNNSL